MQENTYGVVPDDHSQWIIVYNFFFEHFLSSIYFLFETIFIDLHVIIVFSISSANLEY